MNARPEVIQAVRLWVERAEEDLRTAEHTITLQERCPFATICFHAQQCAEKYLKALLSLHSVPFTKTHDLGLLMELVPVGLLPQPSAEEIAPLIPFAVETRYLGSWDPLQRADAEQALGLARLVREAVRSALPLETKPD